MDINFGDYIRSCRVLKGYTRKELSILIGVTENTVSKWEKCICFPSQNYLIPLKSSINIDIKKLLLYYQDFLLKSNR